MKRSNAAKAARSVKALAEPVVVARQLGALEGCGKGTIERVDAWLRSNLTASAADKQAAAADEHGRVRQCFPCDPTLPPP
jgi:hypothetical protein